MKVKKYNHSLVVSKIQPKPDVAFLRGSSVPMILNLITVLQVLFQKYRVFTHAHKTESFQKKK